jgi:hypothetical protein
MQKIVYIYALVDPKYERVRYVGKSVNLENRYEQHLCEFTGVNPRKERWIQNLKDKGLKPELVVIEECDQSNWEEREKYWIAYYRELYSDLTNISDGGDDSWNCIKSRNARVRKFANENHLELKRCFICGGLTVAHLEICKYCLEKNCPGYEESDWYKFLVANDKRFLRKTKIEEKRIMDIDFSL